MEQQELSVWECFVRELPRTDGEILLRVPTVEEIIDFNQYAKAEEDMSWFTCRPDVIIRRRNKENAYRSTYRNRTGFSWAFFCRKTVPVE